MFLKTDNIKFGKIIIIFTDQNGLPLEIKNKVNLTLLIMKQKMICYSVELRTRKICQKIWTFVFFKKSIWQIWEKILITATKTGLDAAKIASKKIIHKRAEAKGEFIGNKIAEKCLKPKPMSETNSRNVEEMNISPEKREVIINGKGNTISHFYPINSDSIT